MKSAFELNIENSEAGSFRKAAPGLLQTTGEPQSTRLGQGVVSGFASALTLLLLVLARFFVSTGEAQVVLDTSASPHARLRAINLTDVQLTEGFWAAWHERLKNTTLPLLYDLANDPKRGAIQNLEIAAGRKQGQYTGNNWMDEWAYKWLEAAACVYAETKDPLLARQMDALIATIAAAQQPDGYLATQNIVRKRPRFQSPSHHEVYVMGHLMTAAAIHHRMTGNTNFLQVACKTGDFLAHQFRNRNPAMAHYPFNPSAIMGAIDLYRATRQSRYLELAGNLIDMRGGFPGGSGLNQDRIPLRDETEVVGHAVFYNYLYAGAADFYLETGDTGTAGGHHQSRNRRAGRARERFSSLHGAYGSASRNCSRPSYSLLHVEESWHIFDDGVAPLQFWFSPPAILQRLTAT